MPRSSQSSTSARKSSGRATPPVGLFGQFTTTSRVSGRSSASSSSRSRPQPFSGRSSEPAHVGAVRPAAIDSVDW